MNPQEAISIIQQLIPRLPMTRAEGFAVTVALSVLADAIPPRPAPPAAVEPPTQPGP